MKFGLFLIATKYKLANPLEQIDGIADSLIYVGAGLLGSGIFETVVNKGKAPLLETKKEDHKNDIAKIVE